MLIEVCVVIITLTLVTLAVVMIRTSFQLKQAISLLQLDLHKVSNEISRVLNTMNGLLETDAHAISQEAKQLISNLSALSTDVHSKVDCFNFLFRPLNFFNSKLDNEPSSRSKMIPQILKWIVSSVFLIKTTKEFIKNGK